MKDNKNKTIRVRVTDDEYKQITAVASANECCSLSDYARNRLLPENIREDAKKRSHEAFLPERIKSTTKTNMRKILIQMQGHTEQISGNKKMVMAIMEDIEELWRLLNS